MYFCNRIGGITQITLLMCNELSLIDALRRVSRQNIVGIMSWAKMSWYIEYRKTKKSETNNVEKEQYRKSIHTLISCIFRTLGNESFSEI